jgi:hypothetical protein
MYQKTGYIIFRDGFGSIMTRKMRESEPKECTWCGCNMWIKERPDGGSILMREEVVGLTCVRCDFIEFALKVMDNEGVL